MPPKSTSHRSLKTRLTVTLAAAALAATLAGPAAAQEDPRTAVTLPADVSAAFLAEMRNHLANLDDIVAALAEGDFKAASQIASIHMSMGHHRWKAMTDAGASDAEIAAAKARFKDMQTQMMGRGAGRGMGRGMGMGMGPGFGRFVSDDFRAMGINFHDAADAFAEATAAVGDPATPADYATALEALQAVTTACRGCHDAFRVTR